MNSSRAHVDRCVITCNTNAHMGSAYCFGGGVKVSGGLLENSLITHNWTRHRGGGVYVEGSGKVYNCTVYGNEASVQQGGGICAYNTSIAVRVLCFSGSPFSRCPMSTAEKMSPVP